MDAKWPRARFGLGRAGWAGPGWLGQAGWLGWLAGLPGLACWAGWAGPGQAGTLPGIGFVDFWNQGQNLIKSSFLGLVFSISGANARKCLNRASWDSFYRLLEPRPESHQIKLPGTGFLDFWSQRQKVFKSSFLGFVLSTSGAKARKSSNRVSWDWFSRLLEPTPEIPSESISNSQANVPLLKVTSEISQAQAPKQHFPNKGCEANPSKRQIPKFQAIATEHKFPRIRSNVNLRNSQSASIRCSYTPRPKCFRVLVSRVLVLCPFARLAQNPDCHRLRQIACNSRLTFQRFTFRCQIVGISRLCPFARLLKFPDCISQRGDAYTV